MDDALLHKLHGKKIRRLLTGTANTSQLTIQEGAL
jgi:hypothetical protein